MTPYAETQPSGDDWPSQVADSIETFVGSVRDKTTGPLIAIARAVVYGTFVAVVGLAALVLFVVAAVRLVNNYLPDSVFGESHVWAAYLILGLVFSIAGLLLWGRRKGREQSVAG